MKRRRFPQWAGGLALATPSHSRAFVQSDENPQDIYDRVKQSTDLRFVLAGGTINVAIAGKASPLDKHRIDMWVRRSASVIAAYFGHFSVARWDLFVTLNDGEHIGPATTWDIPVPLHASH
jgi:hypothetical protein